MIAIDRALLDPALLGAGLGGYAATWATWLTVLRAAFALPLNDADRVVFSKVAGDRAPPSRRCNELWAIAGRGGGKSRVAAALAVFIASFIPHKLAAGEVGTVLVLAASQSQAQVVFRYALGFLEASPVLRQEIASTTTQEIRLRGGAIIAVHANSYRTVRGKTLLACIFDEVAFWRDETTATPDIESYRAVLPSLARTGGMLVGISTGYRKTGLLYQKHRQHYGQNDDRVLVVQGTALNFNPTLDAAVIAAASAADPEAAIAEWEGGFRSDLATFLDDRAIEDCIDRCRPLDLPPRRGICYRAFTDPSGGRTDHFTLAIGHKENDNRLVVDVLRGVVPSDPYDTVHEYAALLREYSVGTVTGDNYAAAWVEAAFRNAGVLYHRSELPKSALYLTTLPLFMRGAVAMPENHKLICELKLLERRVSRVGKDIVDHARHGSDDFANAVCGMLHALNSTRYDESMSWVCDDDDLRLVGRMPVIAW